MTESLTPAPEPTADAPVNPSAGALPPQDADGNFKVGAVKDSPDYLRLQESYKALQARFTKDQQAKASDKKIASDEPTPTPDPNADPATLEDLKIGEEKKATEKKVDPKDIPTYKMDDGSLDLEKIEGEMLDGQLTPALQASLAHHHGITPEVADMYLAGQQALAREAAVTLYDAAGGEAKWNEVSKWAATPGNVPPAELSAFNESLDTSKSLEHAKLAMLGLVAAFDRRNGTDHLPKPLEGGPGGTTGADVYTSKAEVYAAQADPRYRSGKPQDAAYQAEVQKKILRSPLLT